MNHVLWFVTPVHGRPGLTRLCLEQRAHLVAELAGAGIEAHQLVVGDDAGLLSAASELGFQVLGAPNVLGRKLNDGIEWACTHGGATHVSFVGSDDWVHPDWARALPAPDKIRASRFQAYVSPAGDRLMAKRLAGSMGGGPWIIPREKLARANFRPVADELRMSGMDFALAHSLFPVPLPASFATPEEREQRIRAKRAQLYQFDHLDEDFLRMVDFKGNGEQITKWHSVQPADRNTLLLDTDDVWGTLAVRYPPALVGRMEELYAKGHA